MSTGSASSGATRAHRRRRRGSLWRVVVEMVTTCFRYRVTGLAAEVGFFAILSLPPLVLGLVGAIGYFGQWMDPELIMDVRQQIVGLARTALTERSVEQVIVPTLDDVFEGGRFDLVSLGFLLSLWSGSRALNVYVDTITIMYGLGGRRGIIRTRALSFSLYIAGLLLGTICVPLILAGPQLVDQVVPPQLDALNLAYWPLVLLLTIAFLTTLYHVSVPARSPWHRDLPGATLAVAIWIGGSFVLRWVISVSVGSTSIYGPLAAPIVVMLWLYVLAIAVLIGAALNAAVDTVWPRRETVEARMAEPEHAGEAPLTPVHDDVDHSPVHPKRSA